MTDYRQLFDKQYIGHWDLPEDRDAVVTIEKVEKGELHNPVSRKGDTRPLLSFAGKQKRMVVNATNAKTIAAMYGNQVEGWIGKPIALYRTTTNGPKGDTVQCIRVRPRPPQAKTEKGGADA